MFEACHGEEAYFYLVEIQKSEQGMMAGGHPQVGFGSVQEEVGQQQLPGAGMSSLTLAVLSRWQASPLSPV